MEDIERLKKLAGVNEPKPEEGSMGENLSYTGTEKAQYQRKHNIQPVSYTHLTLPTIVSV